MMTPAQLIQLVSDGLSQTDAGRQILASLPRGRFPTDTFISCGIDQITEEFLGLDFIITDQTETTEAP